jgi:hypothetical protein
VHRRADVLMLMTGIEISDGKMFVGTLEEGLSSYEENSPVDQMEDCLDGL